MSGPLERDAARLIVNDGEGRILLFQYGRPNGERYWATPGGGVEKGEGFPMARTSS